MGIRSYNTFLYPAGTSEATMANMYGRISTLILYYIILYYLILYYLILYPAEGSLKNPGPPRRYLPGLSAGGNVPSTTKPKPIESISVATTSLKCSDWLNPYGEPKVPSN